jgi:hypothetical protein
MSDKDLKEKAGPKPDPNLDKKASETVNLSAEELRRISGGGGVINNPPNPQPPPGH